MQIFKRVLKTELFPKVIFCLTKNWVKSIFLTNARCILRTAKITNQALIFGGKI